MSITALLTAQHSRLTLFWTLTGLSLAAPWLIAGIDWSRWQSDPATAPVCAVDSIHDGDTMRLRCQSATERIRLYCIDAPEIAQAPWGEASRDALRRMTGSRVQVHAQTSDHYGRTVAELFDDQGRSLNLAMVEMGHAAVYGRYCQESRFFDAQRRAQSSRLGIWSREGDHQRPWAYRQRAR